MRSRILENQCNSVIFSLQRAFFSIHPVSIHGLLSCDRLSRDSSQKFACESAKSFAARPSRWLTCTSVEYAVKPIHLGRKSMNVSLQLIFRDG
jgi:hypothetical protein